MFGFFSFITNMQPFMLDAAPWEYEYAEGYTPARQPRQLTPPTADSAAPAPEQK
jgi:hypothetical protein